MGGNIVQKKAPVTEIRWAGLYDKNSDKLYAPKQLLPQSDYDAEHKEIFERCVSKYRKLLDGAKKKVLCEIFSFLKSLKIHFLEEVYFSR